MPLLKDIISDPKAQEEFERGLEWWGLLSVLDLQERALIDWVYRIGGTYTEFSKGSGLNFYYVKKLEASAFEKIKKYIEDTKEGEKI